MACRVKAEKSHRILPSKGQNMVVVTYNYLNGCKCHNWVFSFERTDSVCLNPSRGNVLETFCYLGCPSFPNDFCLLSPNGCSLSAIWAAVCGLFVCLSEVRRDTNATASDNKALFSHASTDNSKRLGADCATSLRSLDIIQIRMLCLRG